MKLPVVIEKDEYGYFAYCPYLEGCHSQGETREEVLKNIQEAIELYIETLSEEEKKHLFEKQLETAVVEV